MFPLALSDRVEALIDELIEEGGLASASLASILLAAQDSLHHGYALALSRRVRLASDELRTQETVDPDARPPAGPLEGRRRDHRAK